MLTYTDDKDFLSQCCTSPRLNENRLNYLIDNQNIEEKIRNKMFVGIGHNLDNITPDCNNIMNPTPFMVNEIYRLNSDGYFMTNNRNIKKVNINKITKMINNGLTTEGIEKDIVCKYEKGDIDYKYLLFTLLSKSKHISTLEYAHSLDYRIFDNAFANQNVTNKFLQEYGLKHIDKILAGLKRTGHVPKGVWYYTNIIHKIKLTPKQYDIIIKHPDACLYAAVITSTHTPTSVLEQLPQLSDEYSYKIDLTTKLHIKMKETGFTDEQISSCCQTMVKGLYLYYPQNVVECNYNTYKPCLDVLNQDNKMNEFIDIINDLKPTLTKESDTMMLNVITDIISLYLEKSNHSIEPKEPDLSTLYARKAYLIQQFTDYPTLWNVYEKINIYGNELVDVYNKIRDLSAEKILVFIDNFNYKRN